MPTILKEILDIPECKCLSLVAGANGLNRQIKWTAVIGTMELIRFSNEGDLNFVTGSEMDSKEDIVALTAEAYRYKMAGIVFALDERHIREIPQEAIDFANEHDLPVFTIPWESKISTLTKAIGKKIIGEPVSQRPISEVFKSILLGQEVLPLPWDLQNQLACMGFSYNKTYRVVLFQIVKNKNDDGAAFDKIHEALLREVDSFSSGKGLTVALPFGAAAVMTGKAALMFNKDVQRLFNAITDRIQRSYCNAEIRIGVGSAYEQVEKISDSYNEASLVTNILTGASQAQKQLYFYEDLGVYRIIWENRNQKNMMRFCEETIGALKTHDEINKTNLMDFLKLYFEHNGSIKDLSANLYMHKNTILYKIRKIEGILECDFSLQSDLFNLQLALMISGVYDRNVL